jgi:thioredoxin reductase
MSYFLARAGRSYATLEAGESPGTFFRKFPRHRQLISINKIHTGFSDPEVNLRFDWNSLLEDEVEPRFGAFSEDYFPQADRLVEYLGDYARRNGLEVYTGQRAARISRPEPGGPFEVETARGDCFRAPCLFVATGFTRENLPPIPGLELADSYGEVSLDRREFAGLRVLIVGKGNSAFETADHLIPAAALIHVASPHSIRFAWKTHFVGHLRAVNNNFLDTYQLKSQNAVLDASVERIERESGQGPFRVLLRYGHAQGELEELVYDRVIACTGFRFDASIFEPSCRPALVIDDRFPAQTSAWEAVNVPGLHFLGTLTQVRDFKKTTSGFIHGFRYNIRALHRMLEERHHGRPWPRRTVAAEPRAAARALLERINRTSALWQQFGFLGDVLAHDWTTGELVHFEEMPVAHVHDTAFRHHPDFFVLTLEFGPAEGDPFALERFPDPAQADRSVFLHPVLRHFVGGRKVSEHHLLENLLGEWRDQGLHERPLRAYLEAELEASAGGAPELEESEVLVG